MKKIFWFSLNPTQKLKRYKKCIWILILAIIILFIKFDFMVALGISILLIFFSYMEYKHLKSKALNLDEK